MMNNTLEGYQLLLRTAVKRHVIIDALSEIFHVHSRDIGVDHVLSANKRIVFDCLIEDHLFSTRFDFEFTDPIKSPITLDNLIEYSRRFAAHFGQDVAIGDFTQDSPYRWLIISPDGTVKSVPEDDRYDDEYLHLREDLARPFEPVSA